MGLPSALESTQLEGLRLEMMPAIGQKKSSTCGRVDMVTKIDLSVKLEEGSVDEDEEMEAVYATNSIHQVSRGFKDEEASSPQSKIDQGEQYHVTKASVPLVHWATAHAVSESKEEVESGGAKRKFTKMETPDSVYNDEHAFTCGLVGCGSTFKEKSELVSLRHILMSSQLQDLWS